jgi:multiple RNA-binding domain-containing protein 1
VSSNFSKITLQHGNQRNWRKRVKKIKMSRIIVKNLPKNISEQKIQKLFGDKGVITDVQLKFKDGKFRQFGFVGFKDEESAGEAVKYFNGTYIGSSKISVEPCASLGDGAKPKSWSKYAKDSEAFKKKNKELEEEVEEVPVEVKPEKKKKKKSEKIEEILGDHKNDPMFQEFLKSHAKDKLLWENDIAKDAVVETKPDIQKESIPIENDEEKIADAKISDKDYMKQLMGEEVEETEPVKKENYVKLYTIKIRNIPKKSKRGDLIKFFRPLKAHSVRIPPKSNYAYIGFKLESELKRALNKDKSFLKGKQVLVFDFTDQQNDQPHKKEDQRKNPRWEEQEVQLEGNEDICETGKLFFRNLAYTVTEEDLQSLFEKFGPVAELNLPVDSFTRKIKVGFLKLILILTIFN